MKKVVFRLVICAVCAALMSAFSGACAFAEGSVTVTLRRGDTVSGLCEELGLDYGKNLDAILRLNGLTSEAQLGRLAAGTELILPGAGGGAPALVSGDSVDYYLMPFLFEEGDTICGVYHLWGLRYEKYADAIRSLNDKSNLDYIQVGELLYLPTDAANLMGSDYTTVIAHTMKSGETAYDVCRSYDMDYNSVAEEMGLYNPGVDMTKLQKGQTLHVPLL